MSLKKYILIALLLLAQQVMAEVTLQHTTCEMLSNPLGIDVVKPRFAWQTVSDQRNVMQSAYPIIVSSSPEKLNANEGDLWDSGKINTSESIHVAYNGKELKSRMRCYWKVKT